MKNSGIIVIIFLLIGAFCAGMAFGAWAGLAAFFLFGAVTD